MEEKADVLCRIFQQFRVDDDIVPTLGLYSRVLEEIAVKRQSVWLPLIYPPLTVRLSVVFLFLASSALRVLIGTERTEAADYHSASIELSSNRPESRRDAVLVLLLADSPVHSQER